MTRYGEEVRIPTVTAACCNAVAGVEKPTRIIAIDMAGRYLRARNESLQTAG